MSEPEYVDVAEMPLVADEAWYYGRNGSAPDEAPWTPVKLAELPEKPPTPPTLGGMGIAYPGMRHVFSGPQESAKTLVAYILGLEVLRRNGLFCLMDFEMGRWEARNRLKELGATQDEIAHVLYFEPEGKMPDRVPEVIRSHTEEGNALVVIDAAAGAFAFEELDDNKRMDVEKFGARYVEPFRQAGIATLTLDHVVKSSEARGNYAIGSERKVGQTDIHLGFTVIKAIKRGSSGTYKVTTHKDRGGFLKRGVLGEIELRSDDLTHHITWTLTPAVEGDDQHPFRPTVLMERVSRYLEMQLAPVSRRQVEKEVTGKGTGIRLALDVLRDEGKIEQTETSNGTVVESISLYREDEERGASLGASRVGTHPEDVGASLRPSPYGGTHEDATLEDEDAPPSEAAF